MQITMHKISEYTMTSLLTVNASARPISVGDESEGRLTVARVCRGVVRVSAACELPTRVEHIVQRAAPTRVHRGDRGTTWARGRTGCRIDEQENMISRITYTPRVLHSQILVQTSLGRTRERCAMLLL